MNLKFAHLFSTTKCNLIPGEMLGMSLALDNLGKSGSDLNPFSVSASDCDFVALKGKHRYSLA